MMKPLDKKQFYLTINSLFDRLSTNKKIKEQLKDNLIKRNVLPATTLAIINRNIPVETLNLDFLCLILIKLYEIIGQDEFASDETLQTDRRRLEPSKYFTDNDIANANNFMMDKEKSKKYPLVIPNTIKIADDLYTTVTDLKTIVDWHNNGIIYYNEATQRGKITRQYKNNIIKEIDTNPKSIKDMVQNIKDGIQIPDDLWLNLLKNGEDELEYDEENKVLTIYSGEIDSNDGWHRELAILDALRDEPNIQMNWGIKIANFNESKAAYFVEQQNKRNPLRKAVAESLNKNRLSNLVVDEINKDIKSPLRNKVATDYNAIRLNQAYILYNVLSDAIEYNFQLENRKDVFDVSQWLIKAFSLLIGSYPNEFIKDIAKYKDTSYINHSNMFVGYIAMFAETYKNPNWEKIMYQFMEKINFDKNNELWDQLNMKSKIFRLSNIKHLSNHFKELTKLIVDSEVATNVSL